jgi:palmitoyltransferase
MSESLINQLVKLILENNEVEITKFLEKNPEYDLFSPIDNYNNNIFHKIAFHNSISIFNIFENHLIKTKSKNEIEELINKKNSKGLTPLHYACYKGNIKIIQKLINLGSNIKLTNNKGLNILHLSAQSNQENVLAYFIEKYNFDPMSFDDAKSTPLHWACYFGSENCADFLLSKDININSCDNEGKTPLHIAVLSENVNLIKKLIRYGSNKNIRDNNNNTPLNIAEIKKKKNAISILKKGKKICKCIIIKAPVEKIEKSYFNVFIFILLYLSSIFINLVFLFVVINDKIKFYIYCIFNILNFAIYFFLICFNPGIDKKRNLNRIGKNFFVDIIENGGEVKHYCPRCYVKKNINSRHCFICDRCVEDFDHHCYWINNCVGGKNYTFFIIFIILNILILSYNLYLDFSIVFMIKIQINCVKNIFFYCDYIEKKNWYNNEYLFKLISIINFIVCLFFDVLLFALFGLQIRNYCYNKKIEKQNKLIDGDNEEKIDMLNYTKK